MSAFSSLAHTAAVRAILNAKAGASIDDCIREGIILSAKERVNVTVVHDTKEYRILFNDLIGVVKG